MDYTATLTQQNDLMEVEPPKSLEAENRTSKVDSKSTCRPDFPQETFVKPMERWLADRRPLLKLVTSPTGSGKTHQAARLAVDLAKNGVCMAFVTPRKKSVSDAASMMRTASLQMGETLNIYEIAAYEDLKDTATGPDILHKPLKDFLGPFCQLAKQFPIPADKPKEQPEKQPQPSAPEGGANETKKSSTPMEKAESCQKKIVYFNSLKSMASRSPDGAPQEEMARVQLEIVNLALFLAQNAVQRAVMGGVSEEVFRNEKMRPLLALLFPLPLARLDPGPLLATASKFTYGAVDLDWDAPEGSFPKLVEFRNFFEWGARNSGRLALVIDEEEASYAEFFKRQNCKLLDKDFDLARLPDCSIFVFGLGIFKAIKNGPGKKASNERFAQEYFDCIPKFLSKFEQLSSCFQTSLGRAERLAFMGSFAPLKGMLAENIERLHDEILQHFDWCSGGGVLRDRLAAIDMTRRFCESAIAKRDPSLMKKGSLALYERFTGLLDGAKCVVISEEAMREMKSSMSHLFFNDSFQIQCQDELDNIKLSKSLLDDNLRLETGKMAAKSSVFTLGDYLRYLMAICSFIYTRKKEDLAPLNMRVSDNQPGFLCQCRDEFSKWGIKAKEFNLEGVLSSDEFASPRFAYEETKYMLSFVEEPRSSSRQYSRSCSPLSLVASRLDESPENLLLKFMIGSRGDKAEMKGNLAFAMSATADMDSLSGCLFLPYLRQRLIEAGGALEEATPQELEFIAKQRAAGLASRVSSLKSLGAQTGVSDLAVSPLGQAWIKKMISEARRSVQPLEDGLANQHKMRELENLLGFIWYLARSASINSFFGIALSIKNLSFVMDFMSRVGYARRHESVKDAYYLKLSEISEEASDVLVVLFHAKFAKGKNLLQSCDAIVSSAFEEEFEPTKSQEQILQELLDEAQGYKVLLATAYQTAGRGQNFHLLAKPEHKSTGKSLMVGGANRQLKDFDAFGTASGPYFDALYQVKGDSSSNLPEKMQAVLNHLYEQGSLSSTKVNDLPKIINSIKESVFRTEGVRSHARECIQAIGRMERVLNSLDRQDFFIHDDVLGIIANFLGVLPSFKERLSAANSAVAKAALEMAHAGSPFVDPDVWDKYLSSSHAAIRGYRDASKRLYSQLDSPAIRAIWEAIRSPGMFKPGRGYPESLRAFSGERPAIWNRFCDFVDASWPCGVVPVMDRLRTLVATSPALRHIESEALDSWVLADGLKSSANAYDPGKMLAPAAIRRNSDFQKALSNLGIDLDEVFTGWMPAPQFFFDYVRPYFWELIAIEMIKMKTGLRPCEIPRTLAGDKAYEAYDMHYEIGQQLLCVDVKSWSKSSDECLFKKTAQAISEKLERIRLAFLKEPTPIYLNHLADNKGQVNVGDESFMSSSLFIRATHGLPATTNDALFKMLRNLASKS